MLQNTNEIFQAFEEFDTFHENLFLTRITRHNWRKISLKHF